MTKIPTYLPVVAAAIGPNESGEWLMHRRPDAKMHGRLWEFPGGKIEPGEGARAALAREIAEECGIALSIDVMIEAGFAVDDPTEEGAGRPILLLLFHCPQWTGEATSREGGEWRWFAPHEITQLDKPPLDRQLAERLFD